MKRILLLLVFAVPLTAGALWLYSKLAPGRAEHATAKAAEPAAVAVTRVRRASIARRLTITGELVPFQEVEVMAKVAGYVQKMFVDAGDIVHRGQVLAVLELPEMRDDMTRAAAAVQRNRADLQRATDEIRRAESAYQMAHLTYTRLEGVMKDQPGLIAQQEVDDAQAREQMASAQLASARSALAAAEEQIKVAQADQSKLQTLNDYTRVVAPFDGVVTRRYADNGTMIQAGTASHSQAMPVVRVSENSLLRLVLPVPESAAGLVHPGARLDVRIPSLDTVFAGTIARIASKVDTSTRTMRTEVDIQNRDRKLIPGMYAEVTLTLAENPTALTVPLQAISARGGKTFVTVVDGAGEVQPEEVTTGLESPSLVEIRSGLKEGDLVMTAGSTAITPGAKVTPKLVEIGADH